MCPSHRRCVCAQEEDTINTTELQTKLKDIPVPVSLPQERIKREGARRTLPRHFRDTSERRPRRTLSYRTLEGRAQCSGRRL